MDIVSLYNICNEISSNNSTLVKKDILQRERDNDDFKSLLRFLYDPMIVTGISNKKLNKIISNNNQKPLFKKSFLAQKKPVNKFDDLVDLLNYIKINNTGRDEDILICQNFLSNYSDKPELYDFISKIITKTLKLGMDSKIVRNVYGKDFIYIFEVQNAYSYNNAKLDDNEWFCLSQKMNGNRAVYKEGKFISRQGKTFNGLDHILSDIEKLKSSYTEDMVFDGEIIRKNLDGVKDNENFTLGTGILTSNKSNKTELKFVIFDLLPLDEFIHGESKLTYRDRLLQLKALDAKIKLLQLDNVELVPLLYEGHDVSKIDYYLNKMVSEGKEGCMLARDTTYKCKRHKGLLKVKEFYTMDLEVIGYERGTGKYEDTLGALIVDFEGNEVGVGSGFTDDDRNNIWANREDIIGKIIEVKYKEISLNHDTGEKSLQFPVFVRLRNDKSDISLN